MRKPSDARDKETAKRCTVCACTETSQWRNRGAQLMCNACGIKAWKEKQGYQEKRRARRSGAAAAAAAAAAATSSRSRDHSASHKSSCTASPRSSQDTAVGYSPTTSSLPDHWGRLTAAGTAAGNTVALLPQPPQQQQWQQLGVTANEAPQPHSAVGAQAARTLLPAKAGPGAEGCWALPPDLDFDLPWEMLEDLDWLAPPASLAPRGPKQQGPPHAGAQASTGHPSLHSMGRLGAQAASQPLPPQSPSTAPLPVVAARGSQWEQRALAGGALAGGALAAAEGSSGEGQLQGACSGTLPPLQQLCSAAPPELPRVQSHVPWGAAAASFPLAALAPAGGSAPADALLLPHSGQPHSGGMPAQVLKLLWEASDVQLLFRSCPGLEGLPLEHTVSGLTLALHLVRVAAAAGGSSAAAQQLQAVGAAGDVMRVTVRASLVHEPSGAVLTFCDDVHAAAGGAGPLPHPVRGCAAWSSGRGWLALFSAPLMLQHFTEAVQESSLYVYKRGGRKLQA